MISRLLPSGLRAQLALAIAFITAVGVGASFLALYRGTGARLRSQVDAQLRTQAAEWYQFTASADLSTAFALERTAQRFLVNQRYHAESLINVVQVDGGRTVTNDSSVVGLEAERGRSRGGPAGLLDSPVGLSTVSVPEAGSMRVLAQSDLLRQPAGRNVAHRQPADARGAGTVEPAAYIRACRRIGGVAGGGGGSGTRDADRCTVAADHRRGGGRDRRPPFQARRPGLRPR